MIFFVGDTHFGHENIIKHCQRPFANAEEMNRVLIDQWNSVVGHGDKVYHLGDFAYKADPEVTAAIIPQLNGKKVLIAGNHDMKPHAREGAGIDFSLFDSVVPYLEIEIDGQQLILFHYPIEGWNGKWQKSWHLHGHSHGKAKKMKGRLDVGVDTHDFRPWSWKEIKEHFNPKLSDAF